MSDGFAPVKFAGNIQLAAIGFGALLKGAMFKNRKSIAGGVVFSFFQINSSLSLLLFLKIIT